MDLKQVYLRPGEWIVTAVPSRITTILGSCVAVTLYHRATGTAAMCHGVLPFGCEGGDRGRCVTTVVSDMLDLFRKKGIALDSVQAKVFGGSDMFSVAGARETVGTQNVRAAFEILKHHKIPVTARNVGGTAGRKLVMLTDCGSIYLKHLGQRACPEILTGS